MPLLPADIISEIKEKLETWIKQYVKDSEIGLCTPAISTAAEASLDQANSLYKTYSIQNLSKNDQQQIRQACDAYAQSQMATSYSKSLEKKKRAVNGQTVFHIDKEILKELQTAQKYVDAYVSQAMDELLSNSVQQGVCPNSDQAEKNVLNAIERAIGIYGSDFNQDGQTYLRNHVLLKKDEVLKKYKAFAENRHVTNQLPGVTMPEGLSNPNYPVHGKKKVWSKNAIEPSLWATQNVSFSGADMVATASMKTSDGTVITVTMGEAQTISYSIYRKLSPINSIGNVNAKDYVGGPRTIAGSLVFTVFNQHWGTNLIDQFCEKEWKNTSRKILMDEIAPIDITISMANEYGVTSRLAIYGVRLFSEGQVMSINDIFTENTYQYVALNIDYLASIDNPMEELRQDLLKKGMSDGSAATDQKIKAIRDGGAVKETGASSTNTSSPIELPPVPDKYPIFMDGSRLKYSDYASKADCFQAIGADYNAMIDKIYELKKAEAITNEQATKLLDQCQKIFRANEQIIEAYYDGATTKETGDTSPTELSGTPEEQAEQKEKQPDLETEPEEKTEPFTEPKISKEDQIKTNATAQDLNEIKVKNPNQYIAAKSTVDGYATAAGLNSNRNTQIATKGAVEACILCCLHADLYGKEYAVQKIKAAKESCEKYLKAGQNTEVMEKLIAFYQSVLDNYFQ